MKDLRIFTTNIENEALDQINLLLDQEPFKNCKVRIMPDVHAGKGCVIGFTADLGDKVIPNIVGVDIGCGMLCVDLENDSIDLEHLDKLIYDNIPSGRNIREQKLIDFEKINELHCLRELRESKKFNRAIGTLGGGNHFIEIDIDENDNHYLIIHTGSRNLGKQVAEYYQNLAVELCSGKDEMFAKKAEIIQIYKQQGRKTEIQEALKQLESEYKKTKPNLPEALCYLSGKYKDDYLHDMQICQEYAHLNRLTIASVILTKLNNNLITLVDIKTNNIEEHRRINISKTYGYFETIHNYISFEDNIVRKGAISANKGEMVLIPINMRDGCILGIGEGNADWNNSGPHGAGRIMSRSKAKETFDLEEYRNNMEGIYTTSVNESTIDEAPMVYKSMDEIIDNIKDSIAVVKLLKPIYNFKAS